MHDLMSLYIHERVTKRAFYEHDDIRSYNHIKLYRHGQTSTTSCFNHDSYEVFNTVMCPDLDKTPLMFYHYAIMETAGA